MSIADIIARRRQNNKRYQFTLIGSLGSDLLEYAPDGFANGEMRLVRNKTYRGLFRSISVSELVFYKDGKELLQWYYENEGVDTEVHLQVKKYTSTGYISWVTLKLDFASYEIDDVSVKLQAVDDSFIEKVKNREDTKVNLLSTTSIDGDTLPAISTGLAFVDTSIDNNGSFINAASGFITDALHTVPISVVAGSDYSETQTPSISVSDIGTKAGSYFRESTRDRTLNIDFDIQGEFVGTGTTFDAEVHIKVRQIDDTGATIREYTVGSDSAYGVTSLSFAFTKSLSITISETDSLCLIGTISPTDEKFTYTATNITINETYDGLIAGNVDAWGIYEAFKRTIQQLTGVSDCLYSDKFGRTDLGYAADGTLLHLIKGKALRTSIETMPTTLLELFKSVNSIYNIGLGYVNGKVRIENVSYFYDTTVILDISSKVTNDIISKSVAPELIYKDVTFGFTKYGKKEDKSAYEFNTKANYTSEIKSVTTALSELSAIRADGSSIIRLQHDDDLSKDVDGDNDLFLLKSIRKTGVLTIETNEQFSSITGSVYADQSINLDLSPARSLRRWGNIISPGFIKATGKLRWQDTENNYHLATKKTAESFTVTEAEDVDYSDLDEPLYFAEKYKLTVSLTNEEINTIFTNPNGLIKLSDTKEGWIDELIVDNETNDVQMTLIRKYDALAAASYVVDQSGNRLLDQSGKYIKA